MFVLIRSVCGSDLGQVIGYADRFVRRVRKVAKKRLLVSSYLSVRPLVFPRGTT